jgi:hypothetical protein
MRRLQNILGNPELFSKAYERLAKSGALARISAPLGKNEKTDALDQRSLLKLAYCEQNILKPFVKLYPAHNNWFTGGANRDKIGFSAMFPVGDSGRLHYEVNITDDKRSFEAVAKPALSSHLQNWQRRPMTHAEVERLQKHIHSTKPKIEPFQAGDPETTLEAIAQFNLSKTNLLALFNQQTRTQINNLHKPNLSNSRYDQLKV